MVAADESTARNFNCDVRVDLQISSLVPIGRNRGALTTFGPPCEFIVFAGGTELMPRNRRGHVAVNGKIEGFIQLPEVPL